jgi:hypothetical protein
MEEVRLGSINLLDLMNVFHTIFAWSRVVAQLYFVVVISVDFAVISVDLKSVDFAF